MSADTHHQTVLIRTIAMSASLSLSLSLSLSVLTAIFSKWTWTSLYQNVTILDYIGAKDDGGGG